MDDAHLMPFTAKQPFLPPPIKLIFRFHYTTFSKRMQQQKGIGHRRFPTMADFYP
jgi:hypothetical protein